jgi:hypothetical protein
MSLISSLSFTTSDPASLRVRGIGSMRQKLLERIGDQLALAKATENGEAFQRVRFRRIRDLENDEITETPVRTRVRPWWAQGPDGSILLWIKYGNQVLELQRGKPAIKIGSRADLIGTLETVRDAVRAGELDTLIQGAVTTFKARFSK